MSENLVLETVKGGVKRWVNPNAKRHQKILRQHAADFDYIARNAQKKGIQFNEHEFNKAKEDHLKMVAHALNNGNEHTEKSMRNLRIYPWEGQNNTGYHPDHHAIFIGSEAMAGGHEHYGVSLSEMVTHETVHALEHHNKESSGGKAIHDAIENSDKNITPRGIPDRLKGALDDHREWVPRLVELHRNDRKKFENIAKRLKRNHDVDVREVIKEHTGLDLDELHS